MIRNIEIHVERSKLLELELINDDAWIVSERNVKRFRHLPFHILELPYYLSLACIELGYSILHLQRVQLRRWFSLDNTL